MIATFEYRCRRCNAIDKGVSVHSFLAADNLTELVLGIPLSGMGNPVLMTRSHPCEDGGRGIEDLIGYSVA